MGRFLAALCVGATLLAAPAWAEEAIDPLDRDWLLGFPLNAARFVAQPLAWDREDWVAAGIVGAGFAGLLLLDEPIQDAAQDLRGDATDALADVARPFGDFGVAGAAALATYALGEVSDEPRLERVGLDAAQAVAITYGFTQAAKHLTGRARPDTGEGAFDFAGPADDRDDHAFPSGHASTAFALATVVAEEYDDVAWVPWAAYGIATATGLSRINDDEHWATDVAAGALLGYGVGKVVSAYSPFREEDRLGLTPLVGSDALGLRLTARF